jgi:hypothetical protein
MVVVLIKRIILPFLETRGLVTYKTDLRNLLGQYCYSHKMPIKDLDRAFD